MANDILNFPRMSARTWIDEAVFLAFLLLAFVGLSPFSPPPLSLTGAVVTTGAGDLARQLCYLAVFAAIVLGAMRHRGLKAFSTLPLFLLVLLLWCSLSALWSPEPDVTIHRAGLALVLVVTAMLSVETVGTERCLVLWRWVLLAVLVVNIVSIRFIPAAVHQPGEIDIQLVGDWRGLYGHKNISGSVGAMTALVFLFSPRHKLRHKVLDVAVAAAALYFTVMTRSKSSLGLLAVALLAGGIYRLAWRREIDRIIAVVAGGLLTAAAAVLVIVDQDSLVRLFADPAQFTGRTEIWRAEVAFIRDHLLFGAGFGTFSGTGGISPLHNYVGGWVTEASHGHNGYLQLLVTIGVIGFVLAIAALIVMPVIAFWKRGDTGTKALLFSLFVFLLLHNLMETDFLEGDGVTWVAYLLMLAMLGELKRAPA
jgi:exopolysaccharide production protein ExoQ